MLVHKQQSTDESDARAAPLALGHATSIGVEKT